jgi:hypothetical protein
MFNSLLIYLTAAFLSLYGLRSLIAGIRNEKRIYWINFGYSSGLKKLFKDNYDRINNFFWGTLSFGSGIFILIQY